MAGCSSWAFGERSLAFDDNSTAFEDSSCDVTHDPWPLVRAPLGGRRPARSDAASGARTSEGTSLPSPRSMRPPQSWRGGPGGGASHAGVGKAHPRERAYNRIRIAYAHGFTPAELRRIRELVFQHAAFFLERWNEYFGR
jgi:hypothetical protein